VARHVIFVPGLGDRRKYGQDMVIHLWRLFGLKPHYFPLHWYKPEGFEKKLERLLNTVEELSQNNDSVSVVGVSAGASAAINAFAASDNIDSVILICGKINNPGSIGRRTFESNPDFKQSVFEVERSLGKLEQSDRAWIMSIHPRADQTVPIKDTIIDGAKEKTLPGWSHISGIFLGLILGSSAISKFVKTGKKSSW
jgi:pimeloyl-ACP methyl ester carboxylesterase